MNYKNHAHDRYELQLWLFCEIDKLYKRAFKEPELLEDVRTVLSLLASNITGNDLSVIILLYDVCDSVGVHPDTKAACIRIINLFQELYLAEVGSNPGLAEVCAEAYAFVETGSIGDYFIPPVSINASMVSPVTPVEG